MPAFSFSISVLKIAVNIPLRQAKVAPFATKAQLYTVLTDRTAVDRQLDELRRSNAVRLLQLPTGRDEYAIMLTSDYEAALQRSREEQRGKASSGDQPPAAGAPPSAAVFDWFATRVLPACTEVMITHKELLQLLGGADLKASQR